MTCDARLLRMLSGLCLCLLICSAAIAKVKDPSTYNLRIVVLQTTQNEIGGTFGYHGWGYANLQSGDSLDGVFYKFEGCPAYMRPSTKGYMARWKKEGKQLAIVVNGTGKDQWECVLNVRMDGVVYAISPIGTITVKDKK